MKRHLITAIAALCIMGAVDSYAQRGYARPPRPHHGFRGESGVELSVGYLHSGYRDRVFDHDRIDRGKGLNGLYFGFTKDFTLVRRALYFQTGAEYSYQTSSNKFEEGGAKIVTERNEHYLDIPLRIKFALDVFPYMRAFAVAGPSIDFGLASSLKCRSRINDSEIGKFTYNYYTKKTDSSNGFAYTPDTPESRMRRIDVMMGAGLGVELYDMAVVKFGFDWGLVNKNKDKNVADYLSTLRNTFYLGVGVRF